MNPFSGFCVYKVNAVEIIHNVNSLYSLRCRRCGIDKGCKLLSLFNSSGMASEDSTQERYWSGYVGNRQNRDLLPQLERYINLLLPSSENITQGQLIPYELEFPSLFQLTQQEEQALKDS